MYKVKRFSKQGKEELKSRRQNIVSGIKRGAAIGASTLGSVGVIDGVLKGGSAKAKVGSALTGAASGVLGGSMIGGVSGAAYGALKKAKGDKE